MADVFVSKVRQIGDSLGVLIPKEVVAREKLKVGKDIELGVIHRDFSQLEKLFGSVKETVPFERDRRDRV